MSRMTRRQQRAMFARMRGKLVKSLPQTGERKSVIQDRKIHAKLPGVRISESGEKYTETWRNRSDASGKEI